MAASFSVWIPCNNSLNCHSIKSFQKRDDHLCIQHLLYYCIHVLGFMACASVYMCISSSEAITILCRSFYAEVRVFSLLLRASIMLESEEQLWLVQLFALYFCLILSLLLSGTGSSTGNHFSWAEFQNGLYFGCPITASKHNAKLLFKTMHRQELPPV
jgi:hypothetical protein